MRTRDKLIYLFFSSWIFISLPLTARAPSIGELSSLNGNMSALFELMKQVRHSILQDNFISVSRSAKKIVQQSKTPGHVMAQLVEQLGVDVMRYKEFETSMYFQAQNLMLAAEQKNGQETVVQYRKLLTLCRACHTAFEKEFAIEVNHKLDP